MNAWLLRATKTNSIHVFANFILWGCLSFESEATQASGSVILGATVPGPMFPGSKIQALRSALNNVPRKSW